VVADLTWGSGHGEGTGGGATHIATISGQLSTLESYKGTLYEVVRWCMGFHTPFWRFVEYIQKYAKNFGAFHGVKNNICTIFCSFYTFIF